MSPETLGRYRIVGELGRGATGTVYRAVDPLIERTVAIKTLNPSLPEDVLNDVRERFLREARSAGRLSHPNLVTIYDVGVEGEVAFIAMELLEGQSLQTMLRQQGRLDYSTAADLAAQIAEGLEHAHRHAIVHRDVKPANVIVSATGHAKLTDFGVAYVPSSSMTQTGVALGSPKYMSPEQVLGQPADPRSDVFSLGVMLYEMLVHRTPFEGAGEIAMFELMRRIMVEPHRNVSQLDSMIPTEFDRILSRALAKKPEERYQRAGEMAEALRKLRGVPPPRERPGQAEQTMALRTTSIDQTSELLLAEFDEFARGLEDRQEAELRAEIEMRKRKKDELQRWAETQARQREEFERQRQRASADSPLSSTGRRNVAIEMLRRQAAERLVEPKSTRKTADIERLDRGLRAAFRYLSELAQEVNAASPVLGFRYRMIYLGELPLLKLTDAFADFRMRKIGEREFHDFVTLSYRLRPTREATVELSTLDIARFQQELEALQIESTRRDSKNDFRQVARAAFTLGAIPCQVRMRADYDTPGVTVDLLNVGNLGRSRRNFSLDVFTEGLVDELAQYVLGLDRSFERSPERS
ncbi:MAG TPA: serine/threonine-protein kinase [Burkholderiales bacterium]|nr:serine/threonine-protein kinase [Burkholderiales bacterium]